MTNENSNDVVAQPDDGRGTALRAPDFPATREVGALAAMSREMHEIQASMMLARAYPRDQIKARGEILRQCGQASFAERALYTIKRGDEPLTGANVNLARMMAATWGHVHYGGRVLSTDDQWVHLQGFAWDMQTGARSTQEHKVRKRIFRRGKGWIDTDDERELRELVGRHIGFLERNCILRVIPEDVKSEAVAACKGTRLAVAEGRLKKDRRSVIAQILVAFEKIGVTTEMLESYLGHSPDDLNAEEYADLRTVYNGLEDGTITRSEVFSEKAVSGAGPADLKRARVKPQLGEKAAPATPAPQPPPAAAPAAAPVEPAAAKAPQRPGEPIDLTAYHAAMERSEEVARAAKVARVPMGTVLMHAAEEYRVESIAQCSAEQVKELLAAITSGALSGKGGAGG